MNVICYQSSRTDIVPPFTSQLSAIFRARLPRIFMFQRSWTEPNAEIAPNRELWSPIQPFRFVGAQNKFAQLFRATKSFQKQKNCRTHRGTLPVTQSFLILKKNFFHVLWSFMQMNIKRVLCATPFGLNHNDFQPTAWILKSCLLSNFCLLYLTEFLSQWELLPDLL